MGGGPLSWVGDRYHGWGTVIMGGGPLLWVGDRYVVARRYWGGGPHIHRNCWWCQHYRTLPVSDNVDVEVLLVVTGAVDAMLF